jgi:hypothetical protein
MAGSLFPLDVENNTVTQWETLPGGLQGEQAPDLYVTQFVQ